MKIELIVIRDTQEAMIVGWLSATMGYRVGRRRGQGTCIADVLRDGYPAALALGEVTLAP